MSDDLEWKLEVIDSCPLWAQDLNREIVVQWVIEKALCDLGTIALSYTKSPDIDRPFTSESVLASVWLEDEEGFDCVAQKDFFHIGLAKRWCMAQHEIVLVNDANEWLEMKRNGYEFDDDDLE